jgi:hypothetical protein
MLSVASAFGRKDIPLFYIAEDGNNAVYIAGSSSVDGKGKILISRRFVKLLENTLALKGILAHEMAHLVSDNGDCGCDRWIMRDPMQEEGADRNSSSRFAERGTTAPCLIRAPAAQLCR